MWKFLVKQQKIEIIEREVIADKQISFVSLKFIFDGDWKKVSQSRAVYPVRRNI